MVDVLVLLWSALTSLFRSRGRLEAEILVLRQQINVLRRTSRKRFVFGTFDRLVFVGLYRLVSGIVDALSIVRPETVVRWHRAGFGAGYWATVKLLAPRVSKLALASHTTVVQREAIEDLDWELAVR